MLCMYFWIHDYFLFSISLFGTSCIIIHIVRSHPKQMFSAWVLPINSAAKRYIEAQARALDNIAACCAARHNQCIVSVIKTQLVHKQLSEQSPSRTQCEKMLVLAKCVATREKIKAARCQLHPGGFSVCAQPASILCLYNMRSISQINALHNLYNAQNKPITQSVPLLRF